MGDRIKSPPDLEIVKSITIRFDKVITFVSEWKDVDRIFKQIEDAPPIRLLMGDSFITPRGALKSIAWEDLLLGNLDSIFITVDR